MIQFGVGITDSLTDVVVLKIVLCSSRAWRLMCCFCEHDTIHCALFESMIPISVLPVVEVSKGCGYRWRSRWGGRG